MVQKRTNKKIYEKYFNDTPEKYVILMEKNLEANIAPKKMLSLMEGVSMIAGLIVGSGIFTSPKDVQEYVKTPFIAIIVWVLGWSLALCGSLCFAELGTMIPGSGGEGQYLQESFGDIMVFMYNWISIIILKPGTVAILSNSTSKYLIKTFNILTGNSIPDNEFCFYVISIISCLAVTYLSCSNRKITLTIQETLTFGKIGALLLIIGSGCWHVISKSQTQNFADLEIYKNFAMESPKLGNGESHISNISQAIFEAIWAFEGWNNLNIVAGDLYNPSKNLPLSIWISMVTVFILYLAALISYYAVLSSVAVVSTDTICIDLIRVVFPNQTYLTCFMAICVASSTFGSSLSSMVTSSEVILLAVKEGHIPRFFGVLQKKSDLPIRAYLMQGALSVAFVFISTFKAFESLTALYVIPQWVVYGACVLVLIYLRYKEPSRPRPYKVWISTPFVFLIPLASLLALSCYKKFDVMMVFGFIILIGFPFYYIFTEKGNSIFRANKRRSDDE